MHNPTIRGGKEEMANGKVELIVLDESLACQLQKLWDAREQKGQIATYFDASVSAFIICIFVFFVFMLLGVYVCVAVIKFVKMDLNEFLWSWDLYISGFLTLCVFVVLLIKFSSRLRVMKRIINDPVLLAIERLQMMIENVNEIEKTGKNVNSKLELLKFMCWLSEAQKVKNAAGIDKAVRSINNFFEIEPRIMMND